MDLRSALSDVKEAWQSPRVTIDLMSARAAENHPFYQNLVTEFYRDAVRRHPRLPVIPFYKYGIATNVLPQSYDDYFKGIESSARRNIKKAIRNGYVFQRIDYNAYLADIVEIHRSATVRQGEMDKAFLEQEIVPVDNPASLTDVHDYVYYGVIKGGKLYAYGACMIAGELMSITDIFGHDGYKSDAVVPLLISGMAADAYERYPRVRYFLYDKYFGASPTMRRFKKKFGFEPASIAWKL